VRKCGLSGPVSAERAFVDPACVVVVVPVSALVAVQVEPQFMTKLWSGPKSAGGMDGSKPVRAIKCGAANSPPALGLVAHVDSIARQNPNYLMGAVAADEITDQQRQLILRKRISGSSGERSRLFQVAAQARTGAAIIPESLIMSYAPVHALRKNPGSMRILSPPW
jgi:hypothetical protein